MNIPTQPPQGVMAELRELLATDWHDISDEQVRVMHRALPGLLDEVEALRAENAKLLTRIDNQAAFCRSEQTRASALLARCGGLEAALMVLCDVAELAEPESRYDFAVPIREARSLLAATRTTGD